MLRECINDFEMNYRVWLVEANTFNWANPQARQIPLNRVRFLYEVGQFWATQAWRRLTWSKVARA